MSISHESNGFAYKIKVTGGMVLFSKCSIFTSIFSASDL